MKDPVGIQLSGLDGTYVALVDADDPALPEILRRKWTVVRESRRRQCLYARSSDTTKTRMHNLIMGFRGVDHANGNGLDNRRENLRPATSAENMANSRPRPGCASQFKGVSRNGSGWMARLADDYLGTYRTEIEAARAYDAAAVARFGAYARVNLPETVPPAVAR